MAPRPRSRRNAGFPPYLYLNSQGYFYYRNPVTGVETGLGRNKAQAVTQAVQANLHFQGQAVTLLDKILGKDKRTVNDWCDEFGHHERMKYLRDGLGHYVLENLTALQINEWLNKWNDKPTMRQAMLGTAKTVFGGAIGKGWIRSNPASDLTTDRPVTMRERLTLEDYLKIYDKAEWPLKRAMEFALMTSARRENVIKLERSDVQDGYLHIEHIKAKSGEEPMRVKYPLSMFLPDVKWTLGDIVARCKDNIISKYLIHHKAHAGRAKPGHKYRDKTIEQLFREAREAAGIVARDGHTLPTFHEIRALSKKLWKAQGVDTKILLGHKTERMGDLYDDPRGKYWITLEA
jgi:integrase